MPTTQLIQAFAFDSHAVRVVRKGVGNTDTHDGQPWFVAKDVCDCLDIVNHRDAIAKLDDDERDDVGISDAIGREQQTIVINESGLYALILRSQGAMTRGTPAHTFRKWVTAEVLPAIRQTGRYSPGSAGLMDDKVDKLLDLMEQILRVIPKLLEATQSGNRQKRNLRRMYQEDVARINALRAKGYTLDELVLDTDFSQSQCWAVVTGHYKVLESGRVSIDCRSDAARAADAAAKAERAAAQPEAALV